MIGFALYDDIFKQEDTLEEDVKGKIVDAYSQFVILAVEATKYYKASGRRRFATILYIIIIELTSSQTVGYIH